MSLRVCAIVLAAAAAIHAQARPAPRDIEGVWAFATLTPLERPAVDVGRAVNDYWFERGSDLATIDGRTITSQIVDPPDGRVPALVAAARDIRKSWQSGERGDPKGSLYKRRARL